MVPCWGARAVRFDGLAIIPTGWYVSRVPRRTKVKPELGDARRRLLDAARRLIRAKGYAATTVDDVCRTADVTKGAFFHHFGSKEALGIAVALDWADSTATFFASAPYHDGKDPRDRVLAYIELRKALITGSFPEFTCLAGTLVQEIYESSPPIRDACAAGIFGNTNALVPDIQAALEACGVQTKVSASGLARHTQAVIQGAFVVAKAANDPEVARESLDHLASYFRLLLSRPATKGKRL